MQRILDNYESLQETMEISSHGFDGRASGILALMEKFKIFFGLKLPVLIYNIMEQLSVTLQGVDTNVEDFFKAVNVTIQGLRKHRTDAMFKKIFDSVKDEAKVNKCDPPVLPRQQRLSRRLDDGAAEHAFHTTDDLYRKQYLTLGAHAQ